MAKVLRKYQDNALKALWAWLFSKDDLGNPLVVAPVGAGKSLMIAEFIRQVHERYPNTRIIVLAHVKELLVQNAEELVEQYPDCDFGFYCAGLGEKKLYNNVTFASIQSVHNKLSDFNRHPQLIIVDEVHLISHNSETTYRKFINSIKDVNPKAKVIGFTGTPYRADTGLLIEGEGKTFDGIAYEISMEYMIREGFWAKPISVTADYQMDTEGVSMRGGDFIAGQLEEKVNQENVTNACIDELLDKGKERAKWLLFTVGIDHCKAVYEELKFRGVSCEMLTGKTPPKERDDIVARFRKGEFRCLVNVMVLTTGFNVPNIDLICFMRPTRSPVLYVQAVGRGVRPVYSKGYDLSTTEGRLQSIAMSYKKDCLVLDFGGVIDNLGAIDDVTVNKKKRNKGDEPSEAPTKACPKCAELCHAAQKYCYACGYKFPDSEPDLKHTASTKAVMSMDVKPEWYSLLGMGFFKHEKKGSQPSMKVVYSIMNVGLIYEYVCFEHHIFRGENRYYAYEQAKKWHYRHLPADMQQEPPKTIEDALRVPYRTPKKILIKKNKEGYWQVIDKEF